MKRFILVPFIFLTLLSSNFALANGNLSIKITPRFELANGIINEYVFDEACLNTDNKESQLAWDLKTIPVFGFNADIELHRYVHIDINGSAGIPTRSGYMQDYDWLNSIGSTIGYPEWELENNPTELTNYSKHENTLKKYITFTASLGGNIYLPARITLTPKIAYQYEFIAFDGKNGFNIYKSNKYQKYDYTDKVISYAQEFNSMLLGLTVNISTLPQMFFTADFMISPKMTFLNALDYHYKPRIFYPYGIAFWDNFTNLFQLQSNITAQYKFNKYHQIGLTGFIQYIPLQKGNTRSNSLTKDQVHAPSGWTDAYINGGGTSRLIWSLGLNYSFSL